jgi:ABC-type branched-subunit amino acid transport system substrate-binding protein
MRGHSRIYFVAMTIALLISVILMGCQQAAAPAPVKPAAPAGPIKIGVLTDLTGPIAASSVPGYEAISDWYKYVNDNLSGIQGHKVEVIVVDTKYDANLAVSGFEKLATLDKVNYIWIAAANLMPPVKPLSEKYRIPCSGPTEMTVLLPNTPNSFMYGSIPTYADFYRSTLTYIKNNWKKSELPRIGIMGLDASFAKSTIKPTKWMIETELKWPIVAEEWATMAATDVTSQVTNLKNAKCDYILLVSTGAPQLIFQKTAKAAGLLDQSIVIDTFITQMNSFRKLDPAATTGLWSHSPCAIMEMADEVPMLKTLDAIHKAARPSAPPLDWIRIVHYGGCVAINEIMDKTITKYGYDKLTGDNIKWIMENEMKGSTAKGLLGTCPWTPTSHAGYHESILVKTVPDNKIEVLQKWTPMPPWPDQALDVNFWKL